MKQANKLKEAIDHLAATEDAAVLATFGIHDLPECTDEGENDHGSDAAEDITWESESDSESDENGSGLDYYFPEIDSDDEDDEDHDIIAHEQELYRNCTSTIDDTCREFIAKKRAYIKAKAHRTFMKEQAKHCLLNRKVPNRVSRILKQHPTIGKDIEEFVTERQMGADSWRRTGLTTFDGNSKTPGPKVTFKRIQMHLQERYGHKISYGSVVQLCVVKNKRRLSAKRYKGEARIICRRARKGFNVSTILTLTGAQHSIETWMPCNFEMVGNTLSSTYVNHNNKDRFCQLISVHYSDNILSLDVN